MSTVQAPVSDMLITVKTREIQRGMLAEMRGDKAATARHFLAAAHLEMVLADDYAQDGQKEMAVRSRISAGSCLWRAGEPTQANTVFDALIQDLPDQETTVLQIVRELAAKYHE